MCARFELNKTRFQPTNKIAFWRAPGRAEQLIWAGFARREWLTESASAALVDIPAERYAERSRRTATLVWEEMPPGQVIRGLIVPTKGDPHRSIVRIVTREVTAAELEKFGHDRICVVEAPLYSAEPIPIAVPPAPRQGELF